MVSMSVLEYLLAGENELRLLDLLAGIMIGISPIIHLIIVSGINVPYGKFTSRSWGMPISVRLAWFVQESPALLIPLYFLITNTGEIPTPNRILLGLYIAHYLNRSLIYPMRIRGGKPTPIIVAGMACFFCTYNGYMQSVYLLHHAKYPTHWTYKPSFIIGVIIFLWGMKTNITCDSILRNLRNPGDTGYKIPKGDMFEYVTCGNLFGESVEWIGFAIACQSLQAAAFAVFVILFLSAKSYSSHLWYVKKFEDYPKDRKIFIPFVL